MACWSSKRGESRRTCAPVRSIGIQATVRTTNPDTAELAVSAEFDCACCATFKRMKYLLVIIGAVAASVVAVLTLKAIGVESAGPIGGGIGGGVAAAVASRVFQARSSQPSE
jgi:hypothetical protein